ncbi:DUF2225 domain-containing protein [Dendrosporobacter sp. 1207_IL3150]|uniref:DUF2225 domain-containing protein n=1 Tax=Dendrosporobacter sp. 1207_IL3150 TaxID=3084054 RepID=UPI002FDA1E24
MADYIYQVDKECALCGKTFSVTKVRSRLLKIKQDSDFCTYYQDVNPYYYSIWACPHCGYAAQDSNFDEIVPAAKEKLAKFLSSRQININFSGNRTREQAIATYKLAIFYNEMLEVASSRIGGLYLKLAWLYREGEQTTEEQVALVNAVKHYEQALFRERLPIGNMTEVTLTYLVGDLFRRTGNVEKAIPYFNKIISNQQAKLERNIYNLARDVWQEIRDSRNQSAAEKAGE